MDTTPIKIFFCYSREDSALVKELEKQLQSLKHQRSIDIWSDREISPGTEWQREINRHLNASQVILLCISPDFMSSEYCCDVEMKRAMERYEQGEACVIPIILRPVHWQGTPFDKLYILPENAKPVTYWTNQDEALFAVAAGINKIVFGDTKDQEESEPRMFTPEWYNQELEKAFDSLPD